MDSLLAWSFGCLCCWFLVVGVVSVVGGGGGGALVWDCYWDDLRLLTVGVCVCVFVLCALMFEISAPSLTCCALERLHHFCLDFCRKRGALEGVQLFSHNC